MKKILHPIMIAMTMLVTFDCQAQTIPNSSFENWNTTLHPNDWNTYALIPELSNSEKLVTKDITKSHSGSASAKIISDTVTNNDGSGTYYQLSGMLSLGSLVINQTLNSVEVKSVPFNSQPDSIVFYYQFQPVPSSVFHFFIDFEDGNSSVAKHEKTFTFAKSSWTRYSIPLQFIAPPLQLTLFFTNKNLAPPVNSAFWVDDVEFIYNSPTTTKDFEENSMDFMVYPNPSTQGEVFLKFKSDKSTNQIFVMNELGQSVSTNISLVQSQDHWYTYKITAPNTIANGQYFIKLNKEGKYNQTFKWVVSR